jgi:hypothetical protein
MYGSLINVKLAADAAAALAADAAAAPSGV